MRLLDRVFHLQVSNAVTGCCSGQRTDGGDRGGNAASLQTFLIVSTCFLYLVAAGLFSKAVWLFEVDHVIPSSRTANLTLMLWQWNKVIGADSSESGSGPGSYDIRKSVWHVNVNIELASHTVYRGLIKNPVLQPKAQWRWWLGYLQRHPWLAELCNLRLRPLIRPLLARSYPWLPCDAIQRKERPLAVDEVKSGGGNEPDRKPEQRKFYRIHR